MSWKLHRRVRSASSASEDLWHQVEVSSCLRVNMNMHERATLQVFRRLLHTSMRDGIKASQHTAWSSMIRLIERGGMSERLEEKTKKS